jgi:hypothetical protein
MMQFPGKTQNQKVGIAAALVVVVSTISYFVGKKMRAMKAKKEKAATKTAKRKTKPATKKAA